MFSAIFASMNREKALEVSLPSWTKINKIKDFVIVDWSSSEPLIENKIIQEQINKYGNIKIIRVENQKYFYRCLAWNLAFQNTDPENKILIKLDTEYCNRDSSWIDKLVLEEKNTLKNYFYAGIEGSHNLYGFLVVNKKHFGKGYNENIDAIWGYEDTDFYHRIKEKFKIDMKTSFNPHYVYHLPHSDQLRFVNLKSQIKYWWSKENNIRPIFNATTNIKTIGKDGNGILTRSSNKNFHTWESAQYKILEDSLTYKRVELIEQ